MTKQQLKDLVAALTSDNLREAKQIIGCVVNVFEITDEEFYKELIKIQNENDKVSVN